MLLCEDRPRITLPAEICTTIHSQRGLSGSGAQRWGVLSQRRCDTIERLSYNPSGSSADSLSPLWTYSLLRQKLLRPLLASGITNFVNFCRFCRSDSQGFFHKMLLSLNLFYVQKSTLGGRSLLLQVLLLPRRQYTEMRFAGLESVPWQPGRRRRHRFNKITGYKRAEVADWPFTDHLHMLRCYLSGW